MGSGSGLRVQGLRGLGFRVHCRGLVGVGFQA